MGLRIFLSTFLLIAQIYDTLAQCRVEFVSPPATLSATSYIQPSGQFVIPAVIKPLIDTIAPPPTVPCFPDFNAYSYPTYSPICVGRGDDDDWRRILYCLIFALTNRLGNGCASCGNSGGCGGGCSCMGSYGFGGGCGCGGGCGGNCGFGGGCGCGCGSSLGFAGGCGGGYNNGGGCGCNGGYGCGGNCGCNRCGNGGGYDGGFGCGCQNCGFNEFSFGNGVTYVPYPIIIPSNCMGSGGYCFDPNCDNNCNCAGPTLQAYNGKDTNEINLRIITDSC